MGVESYANNKGVSAHWFREATQLQTGKPEPRSETKIDRGLVVYIGVEVSSCVSK